MTETNHPPISWWRHEPARTATGYRWLDWLTQPYWQVWVWYQTHLFWKTMDERLPGISKERFPLVKSELELIECRAILAELWDTCAVHHQSPSPQLLLAVAHQMYPSGENQDAV